MKTVTLELDDEVADFLTDIARRLHTTPDRIMVRELRRSKRYYEHIADITKDEEVPPLYGQSTLWTPEEKLVLRDRFLSKELERREAMDEAVGVPE